jgi:DNA end-binding protein Ku
MEPGKGGAKAYALLREALRETGMVGIAKVVIKARQHLAAVKPNENALLLEIMRFADELVEPKSLDLPSDSSVRKAEMGMAKELIDQMSEKWHPDKYKDDYKSSLLNLIEDKIKHGGKSTAKAKTKAKKPTNVIDLAAVLKESLKETSKRGRAKPKGKAASKVKHKHAA